MAISAATFLSITRIDCPACFSCVRHCQISCRISGASAYGAIKVDGEKPKFTGPLRLAALDCAKQKLRLADAALQLRVDHR